MNSMIHVGVSTQTVQTAMKAIMTILTVKGHEPETIRAALETMRTICRVEGTRIENCEFNGTAKAKK